MRSAGGGVMVSLVAPLLVGLSLGASFLIGLAAVVRMGGPAAGLDETTGVIRLPDSVSATIAALFTLAALVFLVHLVRRGLSRRKATEAMELGGLETRRVPAWLRTITQLLYFANFAVFAYLVWRGVPLGSLLTLGAGARGGAGFALSGAVPESAPRIITWTFGILAVLAGLGTLALAVWIALGDRILPRPEPPGDDEVVAPLQAAVEDSLDDLRRDPDARRAIVRCYARFEHVAADSGVERKPWLTPMEFMREALGRLPIPRTAGPTLTGLFELARFSQHALGSAERDRALEALDEIRVAMASRDGDGAAQ